MKGAVLIIGLMLIALCSAASAQQENRFTSEELVGYRLTLVSKTGVGDFSFTDKGYIVATIGTIGGGVAGPVLGWKIDKDGRLVIDFDNFTQVWTKRSVHGDLIDIERAMGSSRPYRASYTISRPGKTSLANVDYSKTRFSEAELAGCTLTNTREPNPHFVFSDNGTGVFFADSDNRIPLDEGGRTFRWSVDGNGKLQMTWSSGRVAVWEKLSRVNDLIEAEDSDLPPPPTTATYRRSKQ